MPRGSKKIGLRVKLCEKVWRTRPGNRRVAEHAPDGWYVQVKITGRWYAIMGLCFLREQDAERAREMLMRAGLNTQRELLKAGPEVVRQTACEFLQW